MEERKASVVGEAVKHTAARSKALCEISAVGFERKDIEVNVLSPSKVPVTYGWEELIACTSKDDIQLKNSLNLEATLDKEESNVHFRVKI